MGPTPFYGARAEKNPKADFAMKQTNICRLSGDITMSRLRTGALNASFVRDLDIVLRRCFSKPYWGCVPSGPPCKKRRYRAYRCVRVPRLTIYPSEHSQLTYLRANTAID